LADKWPRISKLKTASIFAGTRPPKTVINREFVRILPRRDFVALCNCAFLSACALVAPYDRVAYEHATNAKVDTIALMNKATSDYQGHEKEVEALINQLDKAYEYDRGRQLNQITVAQWDVLRDPNRNLVGGFLKLWKEKGKFGVAFVAEKKKQVGDAFDQIIQLENGKRRLGKAQ
jgi:hypothetical protein